MKAIFHLLLLAAVTTSTAASQWVRMEATGNDQYRLSHIAGSGTPWRVSTTTDLVQWFYQPVVTLGDGAIQSVDLTSQDARRFWRVTDFPPDAPYKSTGGPLAAAAYQDETWTDTARNYAMPVRIYAPAIGQPGAPFPVVVMSHGIYGSIGAFDNLCVYLASHGYIGVMIQHDDNRTFSREERPKDVTFAIDRLVNSPTNPLLAGRLDPGRIAHLGHSFGAFTSLALLGSTYHRLGVNSAIVSYPDARVRCGIAMSPQGTDISGLHEHSWDGISRPAMTLQGTADTDPWVTDPATRREPYDHMPAGNKAHLTLAGATHAAFTDNGLLTDGNTYRQWYFPAVIAFLDSRLNHDRAAADWLDALTVSRLSGGTAVLETK